MTVKLSRVVLIIVILASIAPFFLIFKDLDLSLLFSSPNDFWFSFSHIFGAVSGFIGSVLLVWEMILGIRYLVSLLTPDLDFANKVHSWIGKYGLLLVLVHPILEMLSYLETWVWIFWPSWKTNVEIHLTYGRIALVLLLIIYITSSLIRGGMKYRPWLYLHYLSYPLMALTFLHALDIGTYLNSWPAIKAAWFTLLALYLVLIIFRVSQFAGFFKTEFKIIGKQVIEDVLYLELTPLKAKMTYFPGQFYYIQLHSFGEAHPFSLMEYNPENGRMLFAIKILGSFTEKMVNLAVGEVINLDGPYGVFTQNLQPKSPAVFIAGGIGITPFVEIARQKAGTDHQMVFLHCNQSLNNTVAFNTLSQSLGNRYINFLSKDKQTGSNIINQRLNSEVLNQILGRNNISKFTYYICGSPGFVAGIQEMLVNLQIPTQNIHLEKFSN